VGTHSLADSLDVDVIVSSQGEVCTTRFGSTTGGPVTAPILPDRGWQVK
jgi:hypothetical protein